jgi:hypothetical protein
MRCITGDIASGGKVRGCSNHGPRPAWPGSGGMSDDLMTHARCSRAYLWLVYGRPRQRRPEPGSLTRTHPDLPWCRYADDGLVHCRNEQEAQALKAELQARLAECRLEMHPTKTKIVYCKDGKRKGT